MDYKFDNLFTYGCAFIILVGLSLFGITFVYFFGPHLSESWFFRIYVVLNLSVLHLTLGSYINESRKNPKRKTYKTKGIRYRIDQIDRIIWTTFGIGLWTLIFCLDVWSIVSNYDIEKVIGDNIFEEMPLGFTLRWLYHVIRQLITIPIAVLWAFCVIADWKQRADQEEREADIEEQEGDRW